MHFHDSHLLVYLQQLPELKIVQDWLRSKINAEYYARNTHRKLVYLLVTIGKI